MYKKLIAIMLSSLLFAACGGGGGDDADEGGTGSNIPSTTMAAGNTTLGINAAGTINFKKWIANGNSSDVAGTINNSRQQLSIDGAVASSTDGWNNITWGGTATNGGYLVADGNFLGACSSPNSLIAYASTNLRTLTASDISTELANEVFGSRSACGIQQPTDTLSIGANGIITYTVGGNITQLDPSVLSDSGWTHNGSTSRLRIYSFTAGGNTTYAFVYVKQGLQNYFAMGWVY
jgi:hypothetical protein